MKYKLEYFGTYPNNDSILLSCSIFKLKKYYNSIDKYINGLIDLITFVLNYKYHIIIYFDHSIEEDELFKKLYNEYIINKNILFCKYRFDDFINEEEYHKNIFGMYIRLLPIFTKEIKYKCLYISDIDLIVNERKIFLDIQMNKFINSKYDIAVDYKIGYEYKYNDLYNIPKTNICVLSNLYFKKHYPNVKKILFKFLNKLNNNDKKIKKIVYDKNDLFVKYFNSKEFIRPNEKHSTKLIDYDLFAYGVDELFTNKYLMKYLLKENISCGVFYLYDSLVKYTYNILNFDTIPIKFVEKLFNKMNKNLNIQQRENLKYKHLENITLNKINYLFTCKKGTPEDIMHRFHKILKRYIKYILVLNKKYLKKENFNNVWLQNLLLHTHKGFYRQLLVEANIIPNTFKKYIKIYSLNKLIKIKNIN